MSNPNNSGNVVGRLGADPKIMPHSNGTSGTALFTVYSDNNYVTKSTGERGSVRVDIEQYVADITRPGVFGFLRKGMLVAVNYSVDNNDRMVNGQQVYGMKLVANQNGIQTLESKQAVAQRTAAQAAQAQAPAQNAAAPAAPAAPAAQAQQFNQPQQFQNQQFAPNYAAQG